jgi:Zn-dependent protease with chaperone function
MSYAAVAALVVLAVGLSTLAPRLLAPVTGLRRSPGAALLLWQSASLAAVAAALLAAPVAAWGAGSRHPVLVTLAVLVSGGMVLRLLVSGHRVGTGLRRLRSRHRDLVDLIGAPGARPAIGLPAGRGLRVLDHPSPTAYCLPGHRGRIVLSAGTLDRLGPEELTAVLAHERAHLAARHDLVLELFSVLHHAVPARVRCEAALSEVHLLVEALADRRALHVTGPVPLARALVTLHEAAHPDATLGAGSTTARTRARLELIADADAPRRWQSVLMVTSSLVVGLTPWLVAVAGL